MTGGIVKKVSELDKNIDKVALIKLVESYKNQYPISVILDCFDIKKATYYRWKAESKQAPMQDQIVEKIKQLCIEHNFIYGYRTITRLLKKRYDLIVNYKKVYRIMKEKGWLCRTKPKKAPNLGKPYYVTENKLNRDFQAEKPSLN